MAADESHAESCGIQIGIDAFLDFCSHSSSVPTLHVRGSPFLSSAQCRHFAFFFPPSGEAFGCGLHLLVGSSEVTGLRVCHRVGGSSVETHCEERNRPCLVSADTLGLFQTWECAPHATECTLVTQFDSSFSLSSQHLSFKFR